MTLPNVARIDTRAKNRIVINMSDPLDRAKFASLFAPTAPGLFTIGDGSTLLDSFTGAKFMCTQSEQFTSARVWYGDNCNIGLYKAGTGGVTQSTFVKFDGSSVLTQDTNGGVQYGIALNDALEDEHVYVMRQGVWTVLRGSTAGTGTYAVSSDTVGETRQVVSGEQFCGYTIYTDQLIGVDRYDIVNFSGMSVGFP